MAFLLHQQMKVILKLKLNKSDHNEQFINKFLLIFIQINRVILSLLYLSTLRKLDFFIFKIFEKFNEMVNLSKIRTIFGKEAVA